MNLKIKKITLKLFLAAVVSIGSIGFGQFVDSVYAYEPVYANENLSAGSKGLGLIREYFKQASNHLNSFISQCKNFGSTDGYRFPTESTWFYLNGFFKEGCRVFDGLLQIFDGYIKTGELPDDIRSEYFSNSYDGFLNKFIRLQDLFLDCGQTITPWFEELKKRYEEDGFTSEREYKIYGFLTGLLALVDKKVEASKALTNRMADAFFVQKEKAVVEEKKEDLKDDPNDFVKSFNDTPVGDVKTETKTETSDVVNDFVKSFNDTPVGDVKTETKTETPDGAEDEELLDLDDFNTSFADLIRPEEEEEKEDQYEAAGELKDEDFSSGVEELELANSGFGAVRRLFKGMYGFYVSLNKVTDAFLDKPNYCVGLGKSSTFSKNLENLRTRVKRNYEVGDESKFNEETLQVINNLNKSLIPYFAAVEKRFETFEKRYKSIKERISELNKNHRNKLRSLKKAGGIKRENNKYDKKLELLKSRMEKYRRSYKAILALRKFFDSGVAPNLYDSVRLLKVFDKKNPKDGLYVGVSGKIKKMNTVKGSNLSDLVESISRDTKKLVGKLKGELNDLINFYKGEAEKNAKKNYVGKAKKAKKSATSVRRPN